MENPLDPVAKNAGLTNSPYGFTGEMHDIEGRLLYLRARYYSPEMMRFIQQDTVFGEIENPLTRNLYAYGNGNPLKYVDPSGHDNKIKNNLDGGGGRDEVDIRCNSGAPDNLFKKVWNWIKSGFKNWGG